MKERLKAFASSRVGIGVICFIVGGFVATLIAPTVIKTKKEIQIVEKEKVVYKDRVVKEVVYKDRIIEKKVHVVKTKITWPNGKIEETEVYESESQQVDRMRQTYEEQYKEKMAELEKQYQEKYSKEVRNPKYFSILAGGGVHVDDVRRGYYYGQVGYTVWGPFEISLHATSERQVGASFGIKF